ncbi:MAG: glycerol-3-phosphate acyltransferase PlsY [Verrucomicrobia bacterium]|nr:MAG: glycerol-3-phosphate acyltransferase PlsY [Verrucomicrobiota bacterium]
MPLLTLAACYLIGCLVSAWYLVRWRTGSDLRQLHSGTTGARNASRILGPAGFTTVALLDTLRGFLAMSLAHHAGLTNWWLTAAGLAVTAGHLWPLQLRFHGGKGLAVASGVLLHSLPLASPPAWSLAAALLTLVLWSHLRQPRQPPN